MSRLPDLRSRDRREELGWKVVSTGSAVLGGMVVRKLLELGWKTFTSGTEDPPLNPADRRISWVEALQWAVAAGVGAGIGRLVAERMASAGWERATGHAPPGVAS